MTSTSTGRDTLVIIDDDRLFRESITEALDAQYEVLHATMTKTGMMRVEQGVDAVLLDIRFGSDPENRDGLGLLEEISVHHPGVPVIMMTGYADTDTAVRALQGGAADFVLKERLDVKHLAAIIDRAIQRYRQQRRVDLLERRIRTFESSELVGSSAAIREVRDAVDSVAGDRNAVVLIHGETGTGKEVAARMVHARGARSAASFVTVNVASLSAERIEGELFGAAAGVVGQSPSIGLVERAHHGVLFLDGISELPMALQGRILRVIETGEFQRVGSPELHRADVQVIAAAQENLRALADAGKFRQDLLYRIKGFEITMPPLRAIAGDVPALAEHFLHALRAVGRTRVQGIAERAMLLLSSYRFPGNARELRSIIERSSIVAQSRSSQQIEAEDLPRELRSGAAGADAVVVTWDGRGPTNLDRELARAELAFIDAALCASTGRKQEASSLLGLPHRHSLPRRVSRIRREFPDLVVEFPGVASRFQPQSAETEGDEA